MSNIYAYATKKHDNLSSKSTKTKKQMYIFGVFFHMRNLFSFIRMFISNVYLIFSLLIFFTDKKNIISILINHLCLTAGKAQFSIYTSLLRHI